MEIQKKKVLIVDDNDDICDVFKFHFENKGFQTYLATSGQEAFACLEALSPDLVVSDIRMPHGDGLELLERMRLKYEGGQQPIVVLMSGFTEGLVEAACELGAEVVLSKPFEFDELYSQIEASLLPLEQQWSAKPSIPNNSDVSVVTLNFDLSQQTFGISSKQFSMGKIGFFIAYEPEKFPAPESYINFQIVFHERVLRGVGRIRWIRRKETHDAHPPGLGVRILSLEDSCRNDVIKMVREELPKTFIPRH